MGTVTQHPRPWSYDANEAEVFMYKNADYSWNEKDGETQKHGRMRCAIKLADAEQRAKAASWSVAMSLDPKPYDGDKSYTGPVWIVSLIDEDGDLLCDRSDVKASGEDDEVIRVIFAEMAMEYL
jgi:hypothetical protein